MKIKVIKFKNYKTPNRAHYNDSGADIFAATDVTIQPGTIKKIPTGVGIELPDGYDAVIHCKSGLSANHGLMMANAPIDAGYRGEIHAIVFNGSTFPVKVSAGDKIGQLVIRPVIYAEFVTELGAERGDSGFGSTGK